MRDRLREALYRFKAFVQKQPLDDELDSEMAVHLELAVEENLRRGLSPEEARREALVRFGSTEQATSRGARITRLRCPDAGPALHLSHATPGSRLHPDCVLILGLGLGANIAVFSVVNTIPAAPATVSRCATTSVVRGKQRLRRPIRNNLSGARVRGVPAGATDPFRS